MSHRHHSHKLPPINKDLAVLIQNNPPDKEEKQPSSTPPKSTPYPPHIENKPTYHKRANPAHPFPFIPPLTRYVSPKEGVPLKDVYKEPSPSTVKRNYPASVIHKKPSSLGKQ